MSYDLMAEMNSYIIHWSRSQSMWSLLYTLLPAGAIHHYTWVGCAQHSSWSVGPGTTMMVSSLQKQKYSDCFQETLQQLSLPRKEWEKAGVVIFLGICMADQFKPTLAGLARKCFGEKKKEHVLTTTVMQILNQMFMPWMNRAKAGEKRSKQKKRENTQRGKNDWEIFKKKHKLLIYLCECIAHIVYKQTKKMEKETCWEKQFCGGASAAVTVAIKIGLLAIKGLNLTFKASNIHIRLTPTTKLHYYHRSPC